VSTVSRGRGESTFYRVGGRAGRSGGGWSSGGRWCFIKAPIMEEEARERPFDEGEMKGVGHRFSSAPSGCGRAAHGGAWRGSVDQRGDGGLGIRRWERTPGWGDLGWSRPRAWPTWKKNPKENENGLSTRSRPKC
jgi:hypothetical protein